MRIQIVQPLPFPPAVLMRALIVPRFHIDLARGTGAVSCEVLDHAEQEGRHILQIRRSMRNRTPVPAVLAKLAPHQVVLLHRDEWDTSTSTGRIEVQIEKVPVRLRAAAVVVPAASGCEQRFTWDIQASVPLIGAMLEKFIAQDLTQAIREEGPIMRDLLRDYVRE